MWLTRIEDLVVSLGISVLLFPSFLRALADPQADLRSIGIKLMGALYYERKIVALRYMNFMMYHLRVIRWMAGWLASRRNYT
jgi:hypothetical protein